MYCSSIRGGPNTFICQSWMCMSVGSHLEKFQQKRFLFYFFNKKSFYSDEVAEDNFAATSLWIASKKSLQQFLRGKRNIFLKLQSIIIFQVVKWLCKKMAILNNEIVKFSFYMTYLIRQQSFCSYLLLSGHIFPFYVNKTSFLYPKWTIKTSG